MQLSTKVNHEVKSGEWAKHLRPFGKRLAAGKARRFSKKVVTAQLNDA